MGLDLTKKAEVAGQQALGIFPFLFPTLIYTASYKSLGLRGSNQTKVSLCCAVVGGRPSRDWSQL